MAGNLFDLSDLRRADGTLPEDCPRCGYRLREIETDCPCVYCPMCQVAWAERRVSP
jgi:predicted Zn-ribbon and HTH transcriptional regulator